MITIDLRGFKNKFINKPYHKYLKDYRRFQIFKGGAGAGKSVFVAQKIIYNMIINNDYNVLCIRKIAATNHDTTFTELKKTIRSFHIESVFKIKESKGAEEIIYQGNGNKILFRGLDDPEKIKSITYEKGSLICVWIEEASELIEEDLNQIDLRTRGISDIPHHIILSFNPISIDHWIKKRFFDRPLKRNEGFVCETTYKDNRFIDGEYKKRLEAYQYIDLFYYKVYTLNQWGYRDTTTVFHNIKVFDFDIPEWDYQNRRYGLDFGFNHANALICTGYKDRELYIWREYYYKQTLNKDFIKSVENDDFYKDIIITGDSASPDKIEEWNQAGWVVDASKKGKDSLRIGIDYLKQLPSINIHEKNCPNAAREFRAFKYRQLKDGTITDQFVEINDDTISAVRYGNEDLFGGDSKPVFTKGIYS